MAKPPGPKAVALVPELLPLARAFAKDPDVVHYKATSLCVGKKVFAMLVNGALVVKLSAQRAKQLVDGGQGRFHTLGTRVMKEWVCVPAAAPRLWVPLAKESRAFAAPVGISRARRSTGG